MRDMDLEHPDITNALKTGYPIGGEPDEELVFCECCGKEITNEDWYESFEFECVCEECLKDLHRIDPHKLRYYQ